MGSPSSTSSPRLNPACYHQLRQLARNLTEPTEVLKSVILITLALGGGSASLFLDDHTPLRLFFATVGIVATLALVLTILLLYQDIMRRIRDLEDITV